MSEVETTQQQYQYSQNPAPPAAPKTPVRRKKNKRKIFRRIVALLIVAAILGGGGYALYKFLNTSDEELGEIYALPAEIGSITSSASGSGSARAKETAAITLTAGGTVKEVFVTSGMTVSAGEPLYAIDSQDAQDDVAKAEQTLEKLNKDMEQLLEEGGNLTVRAPFAGQLQEVAEFHDGDNVGPSTPIATLVNNRTLKLSLYFSYAYENNIRAGQKASVTIPAVMGVFEGTVEKVNKVSYISPEGAIHFQAVITFRNPGTLADKMSASAVITAADGTEIYPYKNGETEFYETRLITAKASGPVTGVGNLIDYALVEEGEALLTLGASDLDSRIRAKQDEIDAAQLKLEEARKGLENFNAVAPIDGTIITCTLSEGAEVKSGDTVIIISNTTTMLVDITVDDRNISFLHPGDTVNLTWNGTPYQGTVTAIDMGGAQQGSGMTRYPVRLEVQNYDGSLMDGAWLQYSFVTSQSDECITVSSGAVRYFSDAEGNRVAVVFVQRESRPDNVPELQLPDESQFASQGQKRTYPTEDEGYYPVIVETGLANTQSTEIKSGVEVGDVVFINFTVTDSSWG